MSAFIDSMTVVDIARQQVNRVREAWLRAVLALPAGAVASTAHYHWDRSDTGCVAQADWRVERAGQTVPLDALTRIALTRCSYCVQQDEDQQGPDEAGNYDRRHVVHIKQHLHDVQKIKKPVMDKLTIKHLVTITQWCEHFRLVR